jgi:hypothetical protein
MRRIVVVLSIVALSLVPLNAAEAEKNGVGAFVSFKDGTLTIKGKSGVLTYRQISENYKTYCNNENGPGSALVNTVDSLGQTIPGTALQVDVLNREIVCGLDYRFIGKFASFKDGTLILNAVDAPAGFIAKPIGKIELKIDSDIPVLESVASGDYKFAGRAGDVLRNVKQGQLITARSENDPDIIEVIQIGEAKRKIERYIGQTRGTVRGTFVSFDKDVLRIRGKGQKSSASNEYDRLLNLRIAESVPIVESIDGGAYQPTGSVALKNIKEGTIITVRKVEEVILEIQIGVAK